MTNVRLTGNSQYGDWKEGDQGFVDGYVRGADDTPLAVVVIDRKNFVLVPIHCLELIWPYPNE